MTKDPEGTDQSGSIRSQHILHILMSREDRSLSGKSENNNKNKLKHLVSGPTHLKHVSQVVKTCY